MYTYVCKLVSEIGNMLSVTTKKFFSAESEDHSFGLFCKSLYPWELKGVCALGNSRYEIDLTRSTYSTLKTLY
jgi:hypothetical protein